MKVNKNLILPNIDSIKDPETKKTLQEILNLLQEMNNAYHSDLTGLEARIVTCEMYDNGTPIQVTRAGVEV